MISRPPLGPGSAKKKQTFFSSTISLTSPQAVKKPILFYRTILNSNSTKKLSSGIKPILTPVAVNVQTNTTDKFDISAK